MRKDLKVGLAVGGVVAAALIVYLLVVPGGGNRSQLSKADGTTTSADGGVSLEPVEGAPEGAPDAAESGDADKAPVAVPPVADAKDAESEQVDPFAKAEPDPVVRADAKKKELDWSRLLNEPPTLIGETPVSTAGRSAVVAEPATPNVPEADNAAEPGPVAEAALRESDQAGSDQTGSAQAGSELTRSQPEPLAQGAGNETADAQPQAVEPQATSVATGNAATSAGQTHVVSAGETFSSIAISAYGNANLYPAIMRANPNVDPTRLKEGMKIALPALSEIKPNEAAAIGASARIAPTIDSSREYRVQPGDSLHKIATRLYGKIDRADKIYQLNKAAIGEDPHRLKVGQVLQLPEPPTSSASASR